ncbi:MAG: hypothetical protein Q4B67_05210 [Eubacteriales bacterium]|nr:hypothetical protein [Eubacteriales bacterium]
MKENEIIQYRMLNKLAEQGGIVIFGSVEDKHIPTGELRQAFALESKVYNRSFESLSINDAVDAYDKVVAPLLPETVLLHLGEADRELFKAEPMEFDNRYRELIAYIRKQNKNCRIAVVSLRNYDNDPEIAEINRHLKFIADSERCEFGDISAKKVWNPITTINAASFELVYSFGFGQPLKNKYPLYDLVKIMFCYNS